MHSFFAAGQLFLLATAPAAHENRLFTTHWRQPVVYNSNEVASVDCQKSESAKTSACFSVIKPADKIKNFPEGATAVLLFVKAKTWIPTQGWRKKYQMSEEDLPSHCLIDIKFASSRDALATQNHATLVASVGSREDGTGEDRDVTFSTVIVPLNQDGTFATSMNHGIKNNCIVEMYASLVGYYK